MAHYAGQGHRTGWRCRALRLQSTQMSFALDLSKACEKAKGQTEIMARKVMLDLFSRVIMKSPVDTGRFRANWNVGYGSPDTTTTESTESALGKVTKEIVSAELGGKIYLSNSLPYSIRLENGWSGQAPAGM